MGTWSAGITGNDTALDMIEEYKVAFSYFDVSTGLQKLDQFVRSNFDESDEDEWCAYFYSLADFMWKNGILTDEIRDKAVQMVDSDFGMETWREAGSEKQRRKELAKFRERITSPQCAPKKIKISHIHPDDIFKDGEVIAIQLKTSGKKYMPNYPCDPIPDEEFLSYDNKYVIIQKAYSKEQHFSGVMPELCDRTAVFVLFKGIYDSPEDVDITKLEKADFKCDDSVLVSFFEHESSLFHFKKRGYKIIGKIEPKFTRAEEGVMAHFLNLGDNGFSSNPDSRLIAAVIDYDIELRECGEGIDEEDLADLVRAEVLRKREYAQGLKTPRTKEDFLERRARIKKAEEELYAAYRTILDSGAKVYEIHYAYPLGYAIKVQKEPAKILLEETTYKYWDIVEKYVREQLDS